MTPFRTPSRPDAVTQITGDGQFITVEHTFAGPMIRYVGPQFIWARLTTSPFDSGSGSGSGSGASLLTRTHDDGGGDDTITPGGGDPLSVSGASGSGSGSGSCLGYGWEQVIPADECGGWITPANPSSGTADNLPAFPNVKGANVPLLIGDEWNVVQLWPNGRGTAFIFLVGTPGNRRRIRVIIDVCLTTATPSGSGVGDG